MAAAAVLCYAMLTVPSGAGHLPAAKHKLRQEPVCCCQQRSLPGCCQHTTWCAQAVESPRSHWGPLEVMPTWVKVRVLDPCAASSPHKDCSTPQLLMAVHLAFS